MLTRILEPEIMDSADDARDYDSMDHGEVNRRFVDDFLAAYSAAFLAAGVAAVGGEILDVGTGTAQIPIELCRRLPDVRVLAIDLADSMLELGRQNVARAGLAERIRLERIDAKQLPFTAGHFAGAISNSIVHHIPEPLAVLAEMARVTRPGGLLLVRDLARPVSAIVLDKQVAMYAAGASPHQRQLFRDSLHAALSLDEIRSLVERLGCDPLGVTLTSDRHWTWLARKPA
jgi:ubiquinone/menaquinone biosynthesis C-methylase UbiE